MKNLTEYAVSEFPGLSFNCQCGRNHQVGIRQIQTGKHVVERLPDYLRDYSDRMIFLVADQNTWKVAGAQCQDVLMHEGYQVTSWVFRTEHPLVPDESALGRMLIELPPDTGLILAVGSGTLNDLSRMLSARSGIPYAIVATAPSMDGYASTVSPMIIEGRKITREAVYPVGIFADSDVLATAPDVMVQAGFGDVLGKFTALADWQLSHQQTGEYICQPVMDLVRKALDICIDKRFEIRKRNPEAMSALMEALILSGVAMGLVGNSRPASGAEHHLAHFWEVEALKNGEAHALHGNAVGVGTCVSARLSGFLREQGIADTSAPKPEQIEAWLLDVGAAASPQALDIQRERFLESVRHAMEIRPRYTVLQLASQRGMLDVFAEKITTHYY